MHWAEKVEQLRDTTKKRTGKRPSYLSIERAAGFAAGTFLQAMKRQSELGVGKALSLAKAMGVSAEWLFDTTKGMDEIQYLRSEVESFQVLLRKTIEACPPGCKIVIDTTMKSGDVPDA